MAGVLPVVLGSRTIDVTSSYSPASLQAGAAIVVTRDSNTPAGDPVVVTLDGLQVGVGANLFVQNGATLVINSMAATSAASSISIGDYGNVVLGPSQSVAVGQTTNFTGREATLSVPGSSGIALPSIGVTITGFSASDVINFSGVAAATSATYSNGTLTLLNGGTTVASLPLTGTFGTSQLSIQSDGHGGYNVGDNVGRVISRQSGSMSQYTGYVSGAGSFQLNPAVATGDGVITPTQGNTVGFSDGIAYIDPNGTASQITRLYSAVLGHAPDLPGLTYWDSQISLGTTNLVSAAFAFVYSPEAIARYGTLTNTQFVNLLYANTGQAPDATAQQLINSLNIGAPRETIALAVVNSAGAIVNNMAKDGDNSAAEVYRLFKAGLGRDPGASGYAYFIPEVQSGMAVTDIANQIINSPEFLAKYGALTNQGFVTQVYQNILGRTVDTAGRDLTNSQFASGVSRATVFANILDSPEARLLTAPMTHQGYVTMS